MRLRWAASAAHDLENIADFLFEQTPQHAPRLVRTIYDAVTRLRVFPFRGRAGKKPGTRELVISSLPYIIVYETREDLVYIVRILHSAQRWPV